jgi:hypothetical protein
MKTQIDGATATGTAQAGRTAAETIMADASEGDLARALAAEMAGEQTAEEPPEEIPAEGGEEANAAAEGGSAPEGEAESAAGQGEEPEPGADASEGEGEAESADDLSQAESSEDGAEAPDPDEVAAQAAIEQMPNTTPAQKQHFQKVLGKRVGKLTARLRTAEAAAEQDRLRAEEAEQRVTELEAGSGGGMAAEDNPLAKISSEAGLAAEVSKAQGVIRQCALLIPKLHRSAEQVEAQLKASGVRLDEWTPEAMREFLETVKANAEVTVQQHVPERRVALQRSTEVNSLAEKHHPWLSDRAHPMTRKVNEILAQDPALKRLPQSRLFVAGWLENAQRRAREQAQAARPPVTAPPKPKPKPPTVARPVAARPVAAAGGESPELKAARERYDETGSQKDLETIERLEAKEGRA